MKFNGFNEKLPVRVPFREGLNLNYRYNFEFYLFTFLYFTALSTHCHEIPSGLPESCYEGVIRGFEGVSTQETVQHIYKAQETR